MYRERLWVPWHWWLVAAGFCVSILIIVGQILSWQAGLATTAVVAIVVGAGLVWYSASIVVDDTGVRAGRAILQWPWVGDLAALDEQKTQLRLGSGADARAWLFVRPYLKTAVEVEVADAADSHPYWLIGTRSPQELAAAVRRMKAEVDQGGAGQ